MEKKMRRLLVAGLVLALSSDLAAWSGITPELRYWQSSLDGSLFSNNAGNATISGDDSASIGVGLNLHFLGFSSKLTYQPVSYNSALSVNQNFQFDGQNYNVGDQLLMDLDWNTLDWQYRWGHFGWDKSGTGGFDAKFLVGVQVVDAAVKIQGSRAGVAVANSNFSETVPIPYIGFEGNVKVQDHFRLEVSHKRFDLGVGDHDVSYADSEFGLRYFPTKDHEKLGSFYLGYQMKDMRAVFNENQNNESGINFDLKGLVASYRIHF